MAAAMAARADNANEHAARATSQARVQSKKKSITSHTPSLLTA